MKKFLALASAIVLGVSLAMGTAGAADHARIDVLGFSSDGRFFAFEQYGVQDGSGFPYAEMYFIDVEKSSWAAEPLRIVREHEEEDEHVYDVEPVRAEVRAQARSTLQRLRLGVDLGRMVLLEDYPDEGSGSSLERKTFEFSVGTGVFRLEVTTHAVPEEHQHAYDTAELLELILSGTTVGTVTLHRDETVSGVERRGQDFEISGVYALPEKGSLAVIVGYYRRGFEGFDRRYLAVTTSAFR